MGELGDVTASQFRAFLSLRQSVLTPEDKKKMLTMTGGGHGDEEGGAVYEDVSYLSVVDRAQEKDLPNQLRRC